jgi:predicted nucleic acid-binding protein
MKAVLDSCVALKWVLTEQDSAKALALRDEFRRKVHDFFAPDIFLVECAHSLARAERKKLIQLGESIPLFGKILSSTPDFHPHEVLLGRALEIASDMRCGVYDCLYVSLAEREGCELVTADEKMLKNLQPRFPFIVRLSDLP